MAIEEIQIEGPEAVVSNKVAQLIDACSRGWERFFADNDDHQAPRFVPSVPEIVFSALEAVTQQNLPPNRVFCEWGSGFGTATCMAALLGYEAYGIEIEEELVRLSRAIARRLGIPVEIICTSMFPEGYEPSSGVGGAEWVTPESFSDHSDEDRHPLRYDGMTIDVADIGLFFAYPWPEEQELIQELFDAVAGEGAILIAYHSAREICVYRKVRDARDRGDWKFALA
jgi:SAM-dependent methyltransferase